MIRHMRQREAARRKARRELALGVVCGVAFVGVLLFSAHKQEQAIDEAEKARAKYEQELRDSGAPEWYIEDRRFDLDGR